MKNFIIAACAGLATAGCFPITPTTPGPANGYADGTKTVTTEGLTFETTNKALILDASGSGGLGDYTFEYKTTSDPNQVIAVVGGKDILLTYNPTTKAWSGSDASYYIEKYIDFSSASGQVAIGNYQVTDKSTGEFKSAPLLIGLETNPNTLNGTATYSGPSFLYVKHDSTDTWSEGTGALSADFNAGTVSGSMSFPGAYTGYADIIANPTTISIDPATISGNGFSSTLSVTPADISFSSVASTVVDGKFFGVAGSDVGATFNGTGTSSIDGLPAVFLGAFIAAEN